jgi:hypothetical protein
MKDITSHTKRHWEFRNEGECERCADVVARMHNGAGKVTLNEARRAEAKREDQTMAIENPEIEATLQLRLGPVLAARARVRDNAFTYAHPACVEYEQLWEGLSEAEQTMLPYADPAFPTPMVSIEGRSPKGPYAPIGWAE